MPRSAGEGSAYTDSSDAQVCQLPYRQVAVPTNQHIDGLWRHGRNHGCDLVASSDSGCVQAIGTCFGISLQPLDGVRKIRAPDEEVFRTCDQQRVRAAYINGPACCLDALDG